MTADTALTTPDCLLHPGGSAALEEDVLDRCVPLLHMAPGFTLVPAAGMGAHIHPASMESRQAAHGAAGSGHRPDPGGATH